MSEEKVKLGDEVKDKVSGFQGVIASEHKYLNGCTRFGIQPPVDKDGKLPKMESFDEPQLELVKKEVAKAEVEPRRTGGPAKHEDTKRPE